MTDIVRRGVAGEPVDSIAHADQIAISDDSTVGDGLRPMLAAAVRDLRAAANKGASERPETVHRFRVGLRRLRSVLSAFRAVLPEIERRHLDERLSSLARRYSRAREWDVFFAGTLKPMATAMPDEPSVPEIETAAQAARARALPEAIDCAADARDVAVAIDAAIWLHRPHPAATEKWHSNLKGFSADLLARHHANLRKRLKRVDITDQHSFHKLRIEIKRVRYPIEMFDILYEEAAVKDYVKRLVAVQDRLGQLNDAVSARDLVAELALSSRAQGLAAGWLAREIAARRRGFPSAARKLRRATPFWE